jgi:hypothetical protein
VRRGPAAAIAEIARRVTADDADAYCETARIIAVAGAAPRSAAWKDTGVRSWINFVVTVLRKDPAEAWPPTVSGLLGWATAFSSKGTFTNYLGAVKSVCLMKGVSTNAFGEEVISRAKMAIQKRSVQKNGSPGIFFNLLRDLVELALLENDDASAALYITSYWHLLRVPSEALPIRLGRDGIPLDRRIGKELALENGTSTMYFQRRKHREYPTSSKALCKCHHDEHVCPACRVKEFVDLKHSVGDAPFARITARYFNNELKRRMKILGVPEPKTYTSKGFRRGRAQDIHRRKGYGRKLEKGGDWKPGGTSAMSYLLSDAVENRRINEGECDENSDAGVSISSSGSSD